MAIGHDVVLALYTLSTAVSFVLGIAVWRYREKPGAVPLSLALFATALYSGPLVVATAVDDFAASQFMIRLLYVGVVSAVTTVFLFVLEFTGRERLVTRWTVAALSIEPILVVVLAFRNPGNVFFESMELAAGRPTGVVTTWGIAAELHALYSYLLLGTAFVLVLEFLLRSRSRYRGQAATVFAATVVPVIVSLVDLSGVFDFDPTPVGFLFAGALFAVAIVRYNLVDVVPIARDRVVDSVSDGIFVVDREDRVIDCNAVGAELLADVDGSPIGTAVDSLFADLPELRDRYRELTATPVETERELALMGGHYAVQVAPIEDGRDRHVGWLFVVRDVTERRRREMRLERQNERLSRFADLVSHDLRNPLTVADGYVDLARETGNPDHFREVEAAHERMAAIIDDVLALAREGRAVTDPEPVDLTAVAERAWESVDTGDATLTVAESTTFLADRTRLLRLFENLFRNAVEHGSTNDESDRDDDTTSPLTVSVGVIGPSPIYGFYVADDGCGLPDEAGRVFEEGFTTAADGTGFGLSIVESVATAHGWTAEAGESEGGGARFEFVGIETGDSSDQPIPPSSITD